MAKTSWVMLVAVMFNNRNQIPRNNNCENIPQGTELTELISSSKGLLLMDEIQ